MNPSLGWTGIARLGLVQTALGAVVVLTTSAMNRVMVVELALPAIVPGALVALHYAVQILRPRFGFGSDIGGRSTPWIVGGMATLGLGTVLVAASIVLMATSRLGGIALATLAYALVGAGVGSCGTSLLALLAKRVEPSRRPAAATMVWLMMIAGFVITTIAVGKLLDPYSAPRLLALTAGVATLAFALTLIVVQGLEPAAAASAPVRQIDGSHASFLASLAEIWREPEARRFTIFVFVSMLAYSGQELILEPFAGSAFGMTPGQSTQLSGVQHGGVLLGMVLVNLVCAFLRGTWLGSLRTWTILGCLASAFALLALVVGGWSAPAWPLKANAF
ncbi:MAG TPA: BCD family MFS transporter, partial [Rhodanobacteraceae bacterium]